MTYHVECLFTPQLSLPQRDNRAELTWVADKYQDNAKCKRDSNPQTVTHRTVEWCQKSVPFMISDQQSMDVMRNISNDKPQN